LPAREYCPAGGVAQLDRHREGVAAYRGWVRGPRAVRSAVRSPGRPARDCPLPAWRASGRSSRAAGDDQRKWQTVYRDSPTSRPSMSSA